MSRQNSPFYRLITAYFISTIGGWLYKLALPLLVYKMTCSAADMAGTFALTFLPFLIFSLFGGVIADRFQRKQVLIICDLLSCFFLVMITIVGEYFKSMPLLYIFVFLASSVAPIQHPSFQSFIPDIIDDKELAKANSLVSSSENFISIFAPILSGVLVSIIGAAETILVNSLCFLLSALLISTIKCFENSKKIEFSYSILDLFKEGFEYVWANPVLKYGSLLFIGSNFSINIFQANLMFYLVDILKSSTQIVGMVFSIIGTGALIGAFVAPFIIKKFESGHIIVFCTILAGFSSFLLILADNAIEVGVIWGGTMALGTVNMVTYFTLRQRSVPKYILGRAVSITRLISFSSIPIAAFLGGILITRSNIIIVIIICATIRLITGFLAMLSPLMRYRTCIEKV